MSILPSPDDCRSPRVIHSSLLGSASVVAHGFCTRVGGVSDGAWASLNVGYGTGDDPSRVDENIRRIASQAGVETVHLASQVHGNRVIVLGRGFDPNSVRAEMADCLATNLRGVTLGVRTADCVPILLADPEVPAVAAVHAGWRGTVARVARVAVETLIDRFDAAPDRLLAAIGPAIGPCCYRVGDEVAEEIERTAPGALSARLGSSWVDLARANELALIDAGVLEVHVERVGGCTACDAENYFSHRRDGGMTGRQLAYISLGC